MESIIEISNEFELDTYYSELELMSMGMRLLDGHGMNYRVYEKDANIYYFEDEGDRMLRLFCCTSQKSFYLG